MAHQQSDAQKQTIARVMHEFKHGELRIQGNGPKVRSPRQAIAIALHEAGASNQESPACNKASLRRSRAKERRGDTAVAEQEGKRAQDTVLRAAASKRAGASGEPTRAALYEEAKRRNIPGRSAMSKAQLQKAVQA